MTRTTLIAGIIISGVLLFAFWGESEEVQILSRFEDLRALAEIKEKQHPLQQAASAKRIAHFFTEQSSFDFTNAGYRKITLNTRTELSQRVLSARAHMNSLELAVQKPDVSVNGRVATVEFTGSALASTPEQEGQFLEIHRIRVFLEEIDSNWLIRGAEHIKNERTPDTLP